MELIHVLPVPTSSSMDSSAPRIDLLHFPILGRLLRWRWSRLAFQLFFFLIASLVVVDGFTGSPLAPRNSATVLAWVHYRGFIIFGLLLIGNLFCFACPFALLRSLARRISAHGRRWPHPLRNKWLSVAGLALIFWLYEWLDLWSRPLLTAMLTLAYFALSFAMESLFTESPFCKYICPLGAFNFTYSTASPFQIRCSSEELCQRCEGKECVKGSDHALGCGTLLYVPQIQSNMDCTFCLDCARACPYDNVALAFRGSLRELSSRRWIHRWDLPFLAVSLAFFGILNAFGMVPPVYRVHEWLEATLGMRSEGLRHFLILGFGMLGLTSLTLLGCSALGAKRTGKKHVEIASQFAPSFIPLGFGIWFAHYGFHFLTSGLTIIPVLQGFLIDRGLTFFGQPSWNLSSLLPMQAIFPIQVTAVFVGFFASLFVLGKRALRFSSSPLDAYLTLLPWGVVLILVTIAALSIFNLPMEMRGTMIAGKLWIFAESPWG
jgi:polyferredoxin